MANNISPPKISYMRLVNIFVLLFFAIICTPNSYSHDQSNENQIRIELEKIKDKQESVNEKIIRLDSKVADIDKTVQTINQISFVISTLISIFALAIYAYTKAKIKDIVSAIIEKQKQELRISTDDTLSSAKNDIELSVKKYTDEFLDNSYKYINITSLRFSHRYDDALNIANWNGDWSIYKNYPEIVQRYLIVCLSKAQKIRGTKDHLKAWDWIVSIVEKNPTADNIESMLRTAKEFRHTTKAIELYDKYSINLSGDEKDRCEPFLMVILRKNQGDQNSKKRLLSLANKYSKSEYINIRLRTTIAAIYRDSGLFDEADLIITSAVKKITGHSPSEDGWDKLFNTYIANCIDMGNATNAIPQAKTLLLNYGRPDHVFNCARVAWRLKENDPERVNLFKLIQRRFDDGVMPEKDDGTIKTSAILKEKDGNFDGAISLIRSSIKEMESYGNVPWALDHIYYYRCTLAELYIKRSESLTDKKHVLEQARDAIFDITSKDTNGEASYIMAAIMIQTDNNKYALSLLESAAKIKVKWIKKAKKDPLFYGLHELDELLQRFIAPINS